MLGSRIKEYMDSHGIKYSYVSDKAKIPNPIFSAMLNGKRTIKAEEYFEICNALNVDKNLFAPAVPAGQADPQQTSE